MLQWKLTDLTVKTVFPLIQSVIINLFNSKIYFFTGESVKRQITDSVCENLTDSDSESGTPKYFYLTVITVHVTSSPCKMKCQVKYLLKKFPWTKFFFIIMNTLGWTDLSSCISYNYTNFKLGISFYTGIGSHELKSR